MSLTAVPLALPPEPPGDEVAAKNVRHFSVEGLLDREVLVFKSMVRLLGHRTNYAWVYSPVSTELRVVAEGWPLPGASPSIFQQVLVLGHTNAKQHGYLCMPLHACELEVELNRLGALIAPANRALGTCQSLPVNNTPMRMLRWPPACVLTTSMRIRMATVMAGKPLTLQELQRRSGENLAVCAAFFEDLQRLDLLVPAGTPAAGTEATVAQPVVDAANKAPGQTVSEPTVVKKIPIQPSLLNRIRMRLGLQASTPSSHASRA